MKIIPLLEIRIKKEGKKEQMQYRVSYENSGILASGITKFCLKDEMLKDILVKAITDVVIKQDDVKFFKDGKPIKLEDVFDTATKKPNVKKYY